MARRNSIMLAYPFEPHRIAMWGGYPVIVQPKLDGNRCRAVIDSNKVRLFSSHGREIGSVPHINPDLGVLKEGLIETDGELFSPNLHHQEIVSIVNKSVSIDPRHAQVQYHIFDIIDDTTPQYLRIANLGSFYSHIDSPFIKLVPSYEVNSEQELFERYQQFLDQGYEGIIIRNPNALYITRRSHNLLKFKPRKQDEYFIVGTSKEISIHGEPKEALGSLICKEITTEAVFSVGTGSYLTREMREHLWKIRSTLPGKWARVEYQELTRGRAVPKFSSLLTIIERELPDV